MCQAADKHEFGYYGYPLAHFPELSWELKQVRIGEGCWLQGVGDPTQLQLPSQWSVVSYLRERYAQSSELFAPETSSKGRVDATAQGLFIVRPWEQPCSGFCAQAVRSVWLGAVAALALFSIYPWVRST